MGDRDARRLEGRRGLLAVRPEVGHRADHGTRRRQRNAGRGGHPVLERAHRRTHRERGARRPDRARRPRDGASPRLTRRHRFPARSVVGRARGHAPGARHLDVGLDRTAEADDGADARRVQQLPVVPVRPPGEGRHRSADRELAAVRPDPEEHLGGSRVRRRAPPRRRRLRSGTDSPHDRHRRRPDHQPGAECVRGPHRTRHRGRPDQSERRPPRRRDAAAGSVHGVDRHGLAPAQQLRSDRGLGRAPRTNWTSPPRTPSRGRSRSAPRAAESGTTCSTAGCARCRWSDR